MHKRVIVSTCDQCGTEEVMDFPARRGPFDGRLLLPPRWIHVVGSTATADLFALDLCPECAQPTMRMAGVYTRKRAGLGEGSERLWA